MVLTLKERIFMVEMFSEMVANSQKEVQEPFQEKSGAERLPHLNCVSALLHKFKETGSVQDKPKSGRPEVVTDTALPTACYQQTSEEPTKVFEAFVSNTRISSVVC